MNAPHLHLVLTHVPVLGTTFGFCLLLLAFIRHSEELKRTALLVFIVAALMAIPAYVTGEPAGDHLRRLLHGQTADATDQHAEIAIIALSGTLLLGLLSVGALLYYRRGKRLTARITIVLALAAMADVLVLGWTANLGGKIRHTETAPAHFVTADH